MTSRYVQGYTLVNANVTQPTVFDLSAVPAATGVVSVGDGSVTVAENGDGVIHQTVLTLAATNCPVTDALAYAGLQLYAFPVGRILLLGVTAHLQWAVLTDRASTINDSASLTWSLGSVTASNVSLTSTMVDMCPLSTKVLSAATTALNTTSNQSLATSAQFDGTGTAKVMFLNTAFATTTDIDADGTLAATGVITATWINLGAYS